MSCDTNKFTITKGSKNTFTFTIKQDNSTLPLEIIDTDTFVAKMVLLSNESVSVDYPIATPATGSNEALNGKITLALSEEDTEILIKDSGSKADRYYLRPTYKITLVCATAGNGEFTVRIPEVYVD